MGYNIKTIDPNESRIPNLALVENVLSDENKLPDDRHHLAIKGFLVSDGIASWIAKDLSFVDKIPQFIKEIMDDKLWECLYVAKRVVTPYYCRYTKGTDSENFQAFITAQRPNGLGTSVETIDRLLQPDWTVQRRFREIIHGSFYKESVQQIRMDDPKKAAEELLVFYQGDELKELIDRLEQGLESSVSSPPPISESPAVQSVNLTDVWETLVELVEIYDERFGERDARIAELSRQVSLIQSATKPKTLSK